MSITGHGPTRRKRSQAHAATPLKVLLQRLLSAVTGRRRHHSSHHHRQSDHRRAAPVEAAPWLVWKEVSIRQLAVAGAVSCFLAWIGWSIIADTVGTTLAASSPDTALWWSPHESAALDQLAQQALTKEVDLAAAADLARRALRANPMDERALFYLGFVAEQKGDAPRADTLARLAGARSWRDLPVQLWLFERSIRGKAFAAAIDHFDALYRVNFLNYAMMDRLFPVLADFTLDPRAFQAMKDALSKAPAWRPWYLRNLSQRLASIDHLSQLYAALDKSATPPTPEELKPYLSRLIRAGRYRQARDRWQALLPEGQRQNLPLLYDGSFDRRSVGGFFDWSLTTVRGADPRIVSLGDEAGHALRIQFSGARVEAPSLAAQLLVLAPGHYRLSGVVKAGDLQTARGLRWDIACADGKTTLAQTDLVKGTLTWTEFAAAFTVPDEGCKAQWLRLQLFARVPSDRAIEGQVWYRALHVERVETPPLADAAAKKK